MVLPPSTSKFTPVMKRPSSLERKSTAFATSSTSPNRPSGTLARNFSRFCGVSGTPANISNLFRSATAIEWREMCKVNSQSGRGQQRANTVASDLMRAKFECQSFRSLVYRSASWGSSTCPKDRMHTFDTAPLLALYQTRPCLGLSAPQLEMLMQMPPFFSTKYGKIAATE